MRQECTVKMGTPICKLKCRNPKFFKPPRLIELYRHFFGEEATFKQHDAEEDVIACAKCYFKMIEVIVKQLNSLNLFITSVI